MSTLTEFEPFVDSTIRSLFVKLDEFVASRKACDIAIWLQYCEPPGGTLHMGLWLIAG